jgi:succinate dehydrogenase / fumarate reductase, cytochrome b subunit
MPFAHKDNNMLLPTSTLGRKLLMAITGQMMIVFVIAHVLGNSTIYFNKLNAYAAGLHTSPLLLWMFRVFMAVVLGIHVLYGIVLTLENAKAKPQAYAKSTYLSATFAGRYMIWTGSMIAAFLVYHLLHFTAQILYPQLSAMRNPDAAGRPDVFLMVVQSFQHVPVSVFYIISLAALLLHLVHGIQSSFQTWGLNSERTFPIITTGGTVTATILFLGYGAIPIVIVAGILK